jgi:hypothetical protein
MQRPPFPAGAEAPVVSSGISIPFGRLFRASGQITHVLRTRAPLYSPLRAFPLDLHVLGTPPAFVLSQDQTLQLRDFDPSQFLSRGELAWCTSICANSRKCGTAFLRRLAIQISKTEQNPSTGADRLESSPDHRGVSRTPVLASGWGGVSTAAVPHRQEESPGKKPGVLSTEGTRFLHQVAPSRQATRFGYRITELLAKGTASTPHRVPRQESGSVRRTWFLAKGRCFYPFAGASSTPGILAAESPACEGRAM